MRVILLLISLFVCTALSAQTFTVYTNTISEHNVYTGQKTPDDDIYYKFTFSDKKVSVVKVGADSLQYKVEFVKKDFANAKFTYFCSEPENTIFFLRRNFVAKSTDREDTVLIFNTAKID
jgi:hypothetical protein